MPGLVDLPGSLRVRHLNFWLSGRTGGSGRGLDGWEQVVWSENRYWEASLVIPPLEAEAAMVLAATGDELCMRAGVLRITFCNVGTLGGGGVLGPFYEELGITQADLDCGYLEFSDGTDFTDGTGHALPVLEDPALRDAAAAGARQVMLDGVLGRALATGGFFSANDFLYRVWQNDDGLVTFNPPLREALPAGHVVRVTWPRVRLRLSKDDGWRPFREFMRRSQKFEVALEEAAER